MGSKMNTSRGVRAVFAGLAAATILSTSACAKVDDTIRLAVTEAAATTPTQLTLIMPSPSAPQRPTPTAGDIEQLNTMHKAAIASLSQRAIERCAMPLDTSQQGPLGNRNLDKLLDLEELSKAKPNMLNPTKAMLAVIDRAGYAVCFDKRLSGSEYASAIYINDKVVSLNPSALNSDKPVAAQQMALSVTLEHLLNFWNKGVPQNVAQSPIAIAMHGGTYRSDFYITQWNLQNLMPAPVLDYKKPVDPNAEKRRWMNEASLRAAPAAG